MPAQGGLLQQSPETQPDPRRLAMRGVHRAIAELRRGTPVLICQNEAALLVGAAETLSAAGLTDIASAALATPVLLLAPVRAAALLRRPMAVGVALRLRRAAGFRR